MATASVRNTHSQCPRDVLQFILDLIKYNDNRLNKVASFDICSHCEKIVCLFSFFLFFVLSPICMLCLDSSMLINENLVNVAILEIY